ncbi:zinc finger BED domain-containing protein 5-like [Palaemon carinicauda]|uniref:zinc finger BED domain-containing protein 5-like n=1 Tax=Palaemon carinicauda TaxID=392227 RepID=UPI0035B58CD9
MREGHRELRPPDPNVPDMQGSSFGAHIGEPLKQKVFVNLVDSEVSAALQDIQLDDGMSEVLDSTEKDLGEGQEEELFQTPQVKEQEIDEVSLDESTDVSSCSQLLVFVRYINSGDNQDEFLFCSALETTTKADDVMEKVSTFFQEEDLQWENVCGEVLESVIKIVNYIKTKALNTRLFKELCKDMHADHEVLLFYTAVRWLSKGNVINRVFEMKDEIKLFLETQERKDLVVHFEDEAWNKRVAYLADIFDQLNKLNLKLQGRETHVLLFQDSLWAFVSKLQNWCRKTNLGNIAMFEKLC